MWTWDNSPTACHSLFTAACYEQMVYNHSILRSCYKAPMHDKDHKREIHKIPDMIKKDFPTFLEYILI